MTAFLSTEADEIVAVRAAYGDNVLNKWFDKSHIKDRFKKARIRDQRLRCCYCQRFKATVYANEWDLEHILCEDTYPQFFTSSENLAIACKRCNGAKREADVYRAPALPSTRLQTVPNQSDRYSIPHPRIDQWSDHLSHVNYQIYTSATDKGKELLNVCELNGPAIKDAGLERETVISAMRNQFFLSVRNRVDQSMTDEEVIYAMSSMIAAMEDLQADGFIVGLERKIEKLTRAAAARTIERALAEAHKIAHPPRRALDLESKDAVVGEASPEATSDGVSS